MRKPYEGHEIAYKRIRRKGLRSWAERNCAKPPKRPREIDGDTRKFLVDVLGQRWAPKGGRAIELGCGTAPILRWVCRRGFSGLGVDVSKTAISMARAQSKGLDIRFRRADLCGPSVGKPGGFDLAVDGHCLHCITGREDRRAFLSNTRALLREGGLFVVLTMCSPVDRKGSPNVIRGQKLVDRVVYAPADEVGEYEGARRIGGRDYMPTRYLGHWKSILTELRAAGFEPQLIRFVHATPKDPTSELSVGALAVPRRSRLQVRRPNAEKRKGAKRR